ncbi:hypothetical protein [Leptospira santarosai]|uniref:hypothetical protein n=3 Tax=Leptospira santarosai TaxID=28183 RepID=UPI000AD4E62F|nr:hypothetical protein [Leptospira santarosai]
MRNSFYSVSQNLTLRSVESSVIEFSEQGERTLRSVESSVIEFSEQGERTLRSLENEGIELPFYLIRKIKLQELSETFPELRKPILRNGFLLSSLSHS